MPELPEVETVRRGMVSFVVGRRIERVEVGRERTVRRTSREALIDGLTGSTVTSIGRRGKYILCSLDTGETLMIHLRMSGRVLVSAAGSLRPDHTHVVLHFDGAPEQELWFVDPRTFGEMVVFDPANVAAELPELAKLGVDPITDGLTVAELTGILRGRARQLKPLLLDQHVIAGIGNIYCDEILHRAKLRPDRLANSLKPADIRRLHDSIHWILSTAIEAGGSTLSDTQYVDVMGDGGSFQLDHRVYDRAGQRCITCGKATIVRTVSGGRSTCFCPRCQH
jgi:formamidopyrimidine-DNA glycosylase